MTATAIPGAHLEVDSVGLQIEATRLLDGVSMRVGRRELIGLIGPNGAGKSTLLRAIDRIVRPTAGAIRLDGCDLARLSPRQVAQLVALVPQTTVLDFGFTCLEVVLMGRNPHLGRFQPEGPHDRTVAAEAMARTETREFVRRAITELSGGERQRVFVARALAQEPRLLLLDEPTSNLDVAHQLQILDLIREFVERGLTAIAAIHDLNLAARYCDRLVLLHRGRVLASGPVAAVLTPEHLATAFGVRAVVEPDPVLGCLRVAIVARLAQQRHTIAAPAAGAWAISPCPGAHRAVLAATPAAVAREHAPGGASCVFG